MGPDQVKSVAGATTWSGRRGSIILGPTEARVARWLADRTRTGRVAIRTVELAAALRLERSEAYRITARLRVLGLFGIQNDQGGTRGGRYYWRTSIPHDGQELDATRHRDAWARVLGWARARATRLAHHLRRLDRPGASDQPPTAAPVDPPPGAAVSFEQMFRDAGGGSLLDAWRRR